MASVPGPRPDRPLPSPGVPAEPARETEEDDRRSATPDRDDAPPWLPEPYQPGRETVEPHEAVPTP